MFLIPFRVSTVQADGSARLYQVHTLAGMVGLAAVYTHAWRGGNAQAALHAWADALSKANGPTAHVNVVPAGV